MWGSLFSRRAGERTDQESGRNPPAQMLLKPVRAGAMTVFLVGLVVVAAFWLNGAADLEFRDRANPSGFQELVLENPRTRLDLITGLQPAPVVNQRDRPQRSKRALCDALFRDSGSPAFGNPGASVQVAAFFDYRCPYCRTLSNVLSGMQGGDLRVVYKEWPVLGAPSELAARAALAADKQGSYLAVHHRLMESRFIPNMALIQAIAGELGLKLPRLRADMVAAEVESAIERNRLLASELQVLGTPALVLNRTIVEGAITRTRLARLVDHTVASSSSNLCQ